MQALRLHAIRDLRLDRVADPVPGPGEVIVDIEAAGICGTDRHLFLGEFPSTPPVTLGHEFSGIVTAVGEGVTLPPGTRVTCDPNIPCLTCAQCLRGRVNLCPNNRPTGVGRDGGFARFAKIPARNAIPLPADLHPHHGAFCEPLACTLHGLDRAALRPGERCLILGGGVIGLLALQLARLAGAEVMMLTRSRAKQDLALSLGADHVAATPEQARQIWPQAADAVIECAGVVDTIETAPQLTANGGRIVILGVLAKGTRVRIEPFDLLFREIQMLHSFLNPFTHDRAARMIASGVVTVAPLITRLLTLAEARAAISTPAPAGEVRAIVVPQ
ncbi:alcohol dehydrogenase catalytic domain-containing protein [Pseudotabrizicola formosa]|uniref:alcohol dehydrogenase catalytic domain-containing protein n=1 Tax=Pseudotabrizicola formosa TaxID=2030009 RepID=UPI000CD2A861|nr:alcohol dehydrogenase catalytic domain-containing protein [Pseudotabrizicola formosa]